MSLSKKILGAWELVAYVECPVDGSEYQFPLTREPSGLILYTTDGYMSAQMMRPGRPPFAENDVFNGTPSECVSAVSGYMAYSGPFEVDDERSTVRHSLYVSLCPNWLNGTQVRIAKLEGDRLHLQSENAFQSGGKLVHGHVTWRRASA